MFRSEILVYFDRKCYYQWTFLKTFPFWHGVLVLERYNIYFLQWCVKFKCAFILFRPAMIKYSYDNIRDLVGPKVNMQMVVDNSLCRLLDNLRLIQRHCLFLLCLIEIVGQVLCIVPK